MKRPSQSRQPFFDPSTRTIVTKDFGKPELSVFCCASLKLFSHAGLVLQTPTSRRHLASPRSVPRHLSIGLFCLSRHVFQCTASSGRNLLLWLRASQGFRGLRENVRIAEVCFALVGRNLQETSLERSGRNSRRRAPHTSPGSLRARFE